MMKKDFLKWSAKKSIINNIVRPPFFHAREIWFCYLGANIGFEQDGKGDDFLRPTLVFRKFSREVLWGIPLTKTKKEKLYYFRFSFKPKIESVAILSQIRLIDARRLSYKMGEIADRDFLLLNQKFKALLP